MPTVVIVKRSWVQFTAVVVLMTLAACAEPTASTTSTAATGTAAASRASATPTRAATPPPAPTSFTPAQAGAVALASVVPLSRTPSISRLGGRLDICGSGEIPYDLATTRLVHDTDQQFSSTAPIPGHLVEHSLAASATFGDAAEAERVLTPIFDKIASCPQDETRADGTTAHRAGSKLDSPKPFSAVVRLAIEDVYLPGKAARHSVQLIARVHNALMACEVIGLDAAAVDTTAATCLATAAAGSTVGATLLPTAADTRLPVVMARTAVARVDLAGFTPTSPPGFDVVCVTAQDTEVRRDPAALSLGFLPDGTAEGVPVPLSVTAVPFDTVGAAQQRTTEEAGLASACQGRVQSSNPKFVPTVVTGHGLISGGVGGAFVTWEERYPSGTTFFVVEVTRAGSVVLYSQGQGTSDAQARERGDLGMRSLLTQLAG